MEHDNNFPFSDASQNPLLFVFNYRTSSFRSFDINRYVLGIWNKIN